MTDQFVTGLEGKVSKAVKEDYKGHKIVLKKGDRFVIRWDFDPGVKAGVKDRNTGKVAKEDKTGKGVHVNAEYYCTSGTVKIAFTPSSLPIVDAPTNRNSTLYDQVVKDQSSFLNYDMKPNTDDEAFTAEERTPRGSEDPKDENQKLQLKDMATMLANKWGTMHTDEPISSWFDEDKGEGKEEA